MTVITTDTVVIGSGISGLTTAALLARSGREVLLVESQSRPGGALRRFIRGGIPFDIGFHYTGGLAKGQILRALWDYLGVSPRLDAVPLAPDGYDYLRIHGSDLAVKAYYSYERLEEELGSIFPLEKKGVGQYLATLRKICRAVPFYNLDLPLTPFLRGASLSADRPLADYLTATTGNEALQAVLSAPAFLHGVPPSQAGLAMHAVVAHAYYSAAWGIKGGGQAVVEALLAVLARDGVDILTDSPARRIEVRDDRVAGLLAGEHEIMAKNVVYTAHPHFLPDLLPESVLRPTYRSRLRGLVDTVSMFIVFGEIEQPADLPQLDKANLYQLSPGFSLQDHRPASAGKSFMLTAPGRRDGAGSRAARGVILMRPADMAEVQGYDRGWKNRAEDYAAWKESETEKMLDCVAGTFGQPYRRIRPLASGSPLTFRDELGSPEGGIYGIRHSRLQYPARARTKLPGLYLSGQNSLMPGLMGASLAALVSAGEISGLEELWGKVRQWA